MPTEVDFLAAVIADPQSDGPRIIFADWLEETGDETRAEFIRIQCALASLPDHELDRHPAMERSAALVGQNYDQWTSALNAVLFPGGEATWWQPIRSVLSRAADALKFNPYWWSDRLVQRLLGRQWRFRRGFAEKLHVRSTVILPAADAIVRHTPLQSLVVQLDPPHDLNDVVQPAVWGALNSLTVFGNAGDAGELRESLDRPSLLHLKRLGLQNFAFAARDFDALAASELLPRLERLTITSSLNGDAARLHPLLAAMPARSLRRLTLGNLWLEGQAPFVIERLLPMPQLTHLDLANNPLGDSDLGSLLDRLPALTHLNLARTNLNDVGLRSILRSGRLKQIRFLNLSEAAIPDQSALDLADSPHLVATTRINLRGVPLSDPVRRALLFRLEDRVLV